MNTATAWSLSGEGVYAWTAIDGIGELADLFQGVIDRAEMVGRTYDLPTSVCGIPVSNYVRVVGVRKRKSGHVVHYIRLGTHEPGSIAFDRFKRKAKPT